MCGLARSVNSSFGRSSVAKSLHRAISVRDAVVVRLVRRECPVMPVWRESVARDGVAREGQRRPDVPEDVKVPSGVETQVRSFPVPRVGFGRGTLRGAPPRPPCRSAKRGATAPRVQNRNNEPLGCSTGLGPLHLNVGVALTGSKGPPGPRARWSVEPPVAGDAPAPTSAASPPAVSLQSLGARARGGRRGGGGGRGGAACPRADVKDVLAAVDNWPVGWTTPPSAPPPPRPAAPRICVRISDNLRLSCE